MNLKTLPYTQKDFDWVNMTPSYMKKTAGAYVEHKKKAYAEIKSISKEKCTFLNTLYALERCDDKFESFFSKMGLLAETSVKKEIRDTAHAVLAEVSQKLVDVEYDKELFLALSGYYEENFRSEKKKLRKEDIKLLEETLREYRRMGFDLSVDKQDKLKSLLKQVSELSIDFRKNINDYQDYIVCTRKDLDGLSERFISSLPNHTGGKYIVTLQYPHIGPFMAEAKNREKRKALAEKNLKKGGMKNLKIIEKLVSLRHQISSILGYKHHADFRTETRMAKNAKTVDAFQNSLLRTLTPIAKKEMAQLVTHAKLLSLKKMEHYDIGYVANDLKKKLYDTDPEKVREYFPLEHVISQMFKLCETLFSISIKEFPVKLWHKDVRAYQISDKDKSLIGYFALDLFPREGKYGHACMVDVVVPHEKGYGSNEYVAPFSAMLCNFPTPSKKIPSLLSIGEVETLFHEFGHLLHMTLSKARLESHAGANVAWDFVETPSQIMENWVWNKEILGSLSQHYINGKRMPGEMLDRVIKGKFFQNAYFFMRQLVMGKLDLDLHTGKVKDARAAYRKMNKLYFNIELPEKETLFPAGFGHLVGYDAGYYSYLWALVYACDAFSEFQKKGVTNSTVGMKWRKEVLEKGSSEDEIKLVTNFLGRKPNQKAFLKEVLGE